MDNTRYLRCIRKKRLWYHLVKINHITLSSYTAYCETLNCLINISEEEYLENKFASLKNDKEELEIVEQGVG